MERSRTSDEKVMLCIVYVAIAAFVYAMNSFMPYYDDDIWYSYRYVAGEELSPLRHIGDVLSRNIGIISMKMVGRLSM